MINQSFGMPGLGMTSGTSTHVKPSGAVLGIVERDHFAFLCSSTLLDVSKSHAALINPSADNAISPQKINVGTCINASPCSAVDYSVVGCGPSDENGTASCSDSVVPGPGVRISECCFFPQPQFVPATPFLTGDSKPVLAVRRDVGFYSFECGNLDAPDYVASGGMCTLSLHGKAYAMHQAYRTPVGF